jgi:hypothetical protein
MILVALADDKGHALWDLVETTGIAKGNLKPKIDSLVEKGAIYKGAARRTTNGSSSHPNDQEQPYFIYPQRYFLIREELRSSLEDIQSKLRHRHEVKRLSDDSQGLRSKLELYRRLHEEFEAHAASLKIKSPLQRIKGEDALESSSRDFEEALGTSEQWSPAQAEIYRIAEEMTEYCLSPEAAVSAAIIARPDLYAAHDKWIKDHMPIPQHNN